MNCQNLAKRNKQKQTVYLNADVVLLNSSVYDKKKEIYFFSHMLCNVQKGINQSITQP